MENSTKFDLSFLLSMIRYKNIFKVYRVYNGETKKYFTKFLIFNAKCSAKLFAAYR